MTEEPIKVFFSYLHRDEEFKDELVNHLSILQRQAVISGWHDRMIAPGSEWDREIDTYLNSADIILLLISANFLASNYCWGVEVNRAMERHEAGEAYVIAIVVRSVNWKSTPFAKLQALPRNAKPIRSWADRDKAFTNVSEGIEMVVNLLRERWQEKAKQAQTIIYQPTDKMPESSVSQMSSNNFHNFLSEAIEKTERGDYQGALAVYNQAIELFRNSIESIGFYYGRANTRSKLGDKYSAIADFDQIIKLKPTFFAAYYGRAFIRLQLDDKYGAIADVDQVIKLKPELAIVYYNRGVARSNLGDKQGAIADFDQAIKLTPGFADSYYMRGFLRFELDDNQGAIADFQKAAGLYQQQGNSEQHKNATDWLRKLQPKTIWDRLMNG